MIPVELIDCAGLIPGAWEGKGLGNQFLDEIRKADALIHIVDVSGSTDLQGVQCPSGTHNPLEDIKFLNHELNMWILQILSRDWQKIVRTSTEKGASFPDIVEYRLSGLGIQRDHVLIALTRSNLKGSNAGSWTTSDQLMFIENLRQVAKPMLIAANKIDIPTSQNQIGRLRELGIKMIPCSAEAEIVLRRLTQRGITEYVPGSSTFKTISDSGLTEAQRRGLKSIAETVLKPWGSTGVQQALETAFFDLLDMIPVYPVEDPKTLSDHEGRALPDCYLVKRGTDVKQLAYKIHTELGERFLYAVECRSGMRLGEDYKLRESDIVSIVSTSRRA